MVGCSPADEQDAPLNLFFEQIFHFNNFCFQIFNSGILRKNGGASFFLVISKIFLNFILIFSQLSNFAFIKQNGGVRCLLVSSKIRFNYSNLSFQLCNSAILSINGGVGFLLVSLKILVYIRNLTRVCFSLDCNRVKRCSYLSSSLECT